MGIIIRLYHRSEGLSNNRFNTFFMDMGENIHVHYRDLRIEFSVEEFLEFADLCETYIPQVRKEIAAGFRDGVNPNTNQSDTIKTFFNKKPLGRNIVYNPTRISLEENTDGFHIHLRNYKLLLDRESFLNFARAARDVLDLRERAVDLDETLRLIEINELTHRVEQIRRDGDVASARVSVEKPYYRKLLQLFTGLGYTKPDSKRDVYEIPGARIELRVIAATPLPTARATVASTVVPLAEYLGANARNFSPREINLLKLQVFDFYEYARCNNLGERFEFEHTKLLFDTASDRVIFPARNAPAPIDLDREWMNFDRFLNGHGIGFVKPMKIPYGEEKLKRLDVAFREYVREHVGRYPCVAKVHLLNPIEWKKTGSRTGRYDVPFLHIAWAKLGSDFDILIELDERYPVPETWDRKFFWKVCGCDYYHLGEVDFPIDNPWQEQFPNIPFRHHLVEAYLFFPSRMDVTVKDRYLGGFPAREVLYEKSDITTDLPAFVEQHYGVSIETLTPLKGVSFNEVFRASTAGGEYIVKVMKGAEFTPPSEGHRGTHLRYECALLEALAHAGAPVIIPRRALDGSLCQPFGKFHCMLLDYVHAVNPARLERGHVAAAGHMLAQVHRALLPEVATTEAYRFTESLDFWLADCAKLPLRFSDDPEFHARFSELQPGIVAARERIESDRNIPWVHCHGDVTPRNVMFVDGQAILYDFQAAHFAPRIADVAEAALEFAFVDQESRIDRTLCDAFVAAAEEIHPLSKAERRLLPSMMFLHAAIKLGRLLRMQVVFGNKVNMNYVNAFLDYASQQIPTLKLTSRKRLSDVSQAG